MRSTLQELLAPADADEFLRDAWSVRPVHVAGPPDKFAALFDGSALDRYLNHRLRFLVPPAIQLYHGHDGGGRLPAELFQETVIDANRCPLTLTSPARVEELIRAGATLMLHSVHDGEPALKRFAAELAAELGENLRVDLFYTPPKSSGVHAHYDREDVLVLQIEGEKEWRLNPPTVAAPVTMPDYHELARAPRFPEQIIRLRRGDLLHIPRGYWHSTATADVASIHLSVRVGCRLGSDLLEWAIRTLQAESPPLRSNLPLRRQSGPPFGYDPATLRSTATALVDELTAFLARPDTLARFNRDCVASDRDPRPYHFESGAGWTLRPDTPLVWATGLRHVLEGEDGSDDGVTLTARGQTLAFSGPKIAALRAALARECFTGEVLAGAAACEWPEVEAVLCSLLAARLVCPPMDEDARA